MFLVVEICILGLSKAFDCVERQALLSKLGWYGISTHWIENYFTGRTQTVKGGQQSRDVPFGVVQGGTLGPIMFSLYTNDLASHITYGKLISYADDSQILHSGDPKSLHNFREKIEADLSAVSRWFTCNGLKVNPTKTEFIILGTKRNTDHTRSFEVNFNDVMLKQSGKIKILGIEVDQNLTWESQCGKVAQKCNYTVASIRKLNFPKQTTATILQALMFPLITYCLPVWAPGTVDLRNRIQKAINFGIRVSSGLRKRDHITQSRKDLKWMTFDEWIDLRDAQRIQSIIFNERAPEALKSLVEKRSQTSQITTRAVTDGLILNTARCRLESTKRSFPYRAVHVWNSLPRSVREKSSAAAFGRQARKHIEICGAAAKGPYV